MRQRAVLPPRAAFVVAGGVLVVALWASGSASMVYPAFAARWRVGEVVTTGLFAVYPVSLVLALVVSGSLSDTLGRRRVLLAGTTVVGAGTALIAGLDDIAPVYAGRALQGAGVGVAMSAASAALVELSPRGDKTLATTVKTATTAAGTVIAPLAGGALAQLSPTTATTTPFLLLLGATTGLLPLLYFVPETLPAHHRRPWRPSRIRPPAAGRLAFTAGVACLTVAFMVGAVVFLMGCVRAPILGSPRPLPRHRRAALLSPPLALSSAKSPDTPAPPHAAAVARPRSSWIREAPQA